MKTPHPGEKMTREEAREYVLNSLKIILEHGEDERTIEEN